MTNKQIQLVLTALGYSPGAVDGILLNQTKAAIREFQKDANLTVDGVAGKLTQAAMCEWLIAGKTKPQSAEKPKADSRMSFWEDIKYFTRSEFRCPCPRCGGFPAEPKETLVRLADRIRASAGAKATVSSGVRCKVHNAEVGGVGNSRHLYGQAMDFCIAGLSSTQLLQLVQQQKDTAYAYAIDNRFVHMDVT